MEKKQSIGALWLNESQSGKKYMSGHVEIDGAKHKIVVFKNDYKEEDKHPDYKIYPSVERKSGEPKKSDTFEDDVPF